MGDNGKGREVLEPQVRRMSVCVFVCVVVCVWQAFHESLELGEEVIIAQLGKNMSQLGLGMKQYKLGIAYTQAEHHFQARGLT